MPKITSSADLRKQIESGKIEYAPYLTTTYIYVQEAAGKYGK